MVLEAGRSSTQTQSCNMICRLSDDFRDMSQNTNIGFYHQQDRTETAVENLACQAR